MTQKTETSAEAVERLDDETLLAQINRHDPYDVEFVGRYRALLTDRDTYKARVEAAEGALRFYGGVMPISFAPGQDGGERARATLAQIDAEPTEPGPTLADAYRAGLEAATAAVRDAGDIKPFSTVADVKWRIEQALSALPVPTEFGGE